MNPRPDACRGCPLDSHPKTQGFVPPDGPPAAPILLFGEAAGEEEARTGVPFSGAAGGMLNRLLTRNHWDRRMFRIANIISCRPSNNWFDERAPWYWGARAHCAVHRDPVLAEGHPVVVPLGGTALKTLLGIDKGIRVEDWHGTVTRDPTDRFWVIPTYHPSHLQRGAHNLFGVVSFDLQQAVKVSQEGFTPEQPDILVDPPLDWATWWVGQVEAAAVADPDGVWLTVDIETPDKSSGQDEGELTTEDRSYTILRVNFSVHPDEGVTFPYAGPYIHLIDRLLKLPCVKTGWNCPTPDQRVLTADLRWVRAGDLKVGDQLVGFDEDVPEGRRTRRYCTTTVTHAGRSLAQVYAVHLSDGQVIKVTGDHPWLVKPPRGVRRRMYNWVKTTDLREGQTIQRLFHTWETGTTRAHGYLAGFFDGEGNLSVQSVTKTLRISAAQNKGPLFDYVCDLMEGFGYPFGRYSTGRKKDSNCWNAHLLGRTADQAKFLGEIRPERLLPKFTPEQLGALQAWQTQAAVITAVVPLGVQETVALSTSTHTYILEGFGAHNCEYDMPRLRAANHQVNGTIIDGMWFWHFLQSDLPRGLGFAAPFYSKFGAWKHLATSDPGYYAACDGFQNWRTVDGIARHLQQLGMWDRAFRHITQLHDRVLKPAQSVGIKIDRAALVVFIADLEEKQKGILKAMQGLVPEEVRPLTPKGGYKRAPEEGRVHGKSTGVKRDGTSKKEQPDDVKAGLYANAVIVKRTVSVTGYFCRTCGTQDVAKRHHCGEGADAADLNFQTYDADRWFWQEPFNPDSPQQILAYLAHRKHKPGRAKKTGADSTDRDTLTRLFRETKDPLYKLILDSRAVGKVKGTYGVGTLKRLDEEDRVHPVPTFRPSTGRLSYVDPNITNVVADKGEGERASLASGFRNVVVSGDTLPSWVTPEGLTEWERKWI